MIFHCVLNILKTALDHPPHPTGLLLCFFVVNFGLKLNAQRVTSIEQAARMVEMLKVYSGRIGKELVSSDS